MLLEKSLLDFPVCFMCQDMKRKLMHEYKLEIHLYKNNKNINFDGDLNYFQVIIC